MPDHPVLNNKKYHRILGSFGPELVCAFSTRHSDNMSLYYGDTANALSSRIKFLGDLDINYRDIVCAKQVHSSRIANVREKEKGSGALAYDNSISDTDAFITNIKGLPLAIFTADCLSVFLYDPRNKAIGLAHAGWKSAKDNIVIKTIESMCREFGSRPRDLCVGFGPSIRSCCYEVKSDFNDFFPGQLIKRENLHYFDLSKVNKVQALSAGVKEENIFDSGICTSCRNSDFYSYRKESISSGRMMSVMMLR
jgi:YfiH family protein